MQQAYAQANDTVNKANQQAQGILDSATQDANNIRYSALTYTDDMLANLGNILGSTIDDTGSRFNAMMQSLQNAYNTVKQNRQELAPQAQQGSPAPEPADQKETAPEEDTISDDDYDDDFDADDADDDDI